MAAGAAAAAAGGAGGLPAPPRPLPLRAGARGPGAGAGRRPRLPRPGAEHGAALLRQIRPPRGLCECARPARRGGDRGWEGGGGAGRPSGPGRKEASGRGPCGAGRTWASGAGTDPPAAPSPSARALGLQGRCAPASRPRRPHRPGAAVGELARLGDSPRVRGPVRTPLPPSGTRYPGTLLSIAAGEWVSPWVRSLWGPDTGSVGAQRAQGRTGPPRPPLRPGQGADGAPHWGVRLRLRLSHGPALRWSSFQPRVQGRGSWAPPRSNFQWASMVTRVPPPPWVRGQVTSGSREAALNRRGALACSSRPLGALPAPAAHHVDCI